MKTKPVRSDHWDPMNGQRKYQARGGTPFYPNERGTNGIREMYGTQKSHVCLIWFKKHTDKTLTDVQKDAINVAMTRWTRGGHSVSIWMLDPTEHDRRGIQVFNVAQRVFDFRTVLHKYKYSNIFNSIQDENQYNTPSLYLKVDLAKLLIPLHILEYGVDGVKFEHCIASDLDLGKNDGGTFHEEVFDLKSIYDDDTERMLNDIGVVYAKGPEGLLHYENSFAIFKNMPHVRSALTLFIRYNMFFVEENKYLPELVYGLLPDFYKIVQALKLEIDANQGGCWSTLSDFLRENPDPATTVKLFQEYLDDRAVETREVCSESLKIFCSENEHLDEPVLFSKFLKYFVLSFKSREKSRIFANLKLVPLPTSNALHGTYSGGSSGPTRENHLYRKTFLSAATILLIVTSAASVVGSIR
jgi:hypothetical protein